ncbi:MAG: ribonuclease D [Chloroflexota bacterium]
MQAPVGLSQSAPGAGVSYARTTGDVAAVAVEARATGRLGLDTEFLRERTYFAKLCLVQVATPRAITLIDALAGCDLTPLAEALADPEVEVILHAGRQDLQIMHELSGLAPTNVFDVQVAAAFAGYGASLAYGRLVEETVGAKLAKAESYTDWTRRPLSPAQLAYAADDVRYLLPAADRLEQQLTRLGRLEWAREEMRGLQGAALYGHGEDDLWQKVAGHGVLSAQQTAILKELAIWRDQAAASRDVPRAWLIKDPTLLELARRAPATQAELHAIRGLDAHEITRVGAGILAAIAQGQQAPPIAAQPRPSKEHVARARMLGSLADAVVRAHAEGAGIAPELIATRAELEALLMDVMLGRASPDRHRLLTGWRKELAGEAVLALAAGKMALRPLDRAPYIEELPLD